MISTGKCTLTPKIQKHTPLVRRLAHQFIAKLPANVELDDLLQVGFIGLSEALQRFDPSQGVQFETFATQRIRGAMLDSLRQDDWMSRGNRRKQRRIEAATQALSHQLGRAPKELEIATFMRIGLLEFQEMRARTHGAGLTYLEDLAPSDNPDSEGTHRYLSDEQGDPVVILEDKSRRERLVEAIGKLPDRLQYVMEMLYENDMTLKEIGDLLQVTESRVCQLHGEAVVKIQRMLAITTGPVRFTSAIISSNQANYEADQDLISAYEVPQQQEDNNHVSSPGLVPFQEEDYDDIITPGFRFKS